MHRLRKISGILHLWIGLITGIVILLVSLSGCLLVFEEPLFNLIHPGLVYTPAAGGSTRPLSALTATAQKALGPGKPVNTITIYPDPDRSFVFGASGSGKNHSTHRTAFDQVDYLDEVYVDPYTGKVLGQIDRKHEFFTVLLWLHRYLLLYPSVGRPIVGISTLLFLVLLLTGVVLWFPRNRGARKQRFRILLRARWRRVNYDLHATGGFYVLLLGAVMAVTGLTWSFKWWESGIYRLLGTDRPLSVKREQLPVASRPAADIRPLDIAMRSVYGKAPRFEQISIDLPQKANQPIMAIVQVSSGTGWRVVDYYYYHSITGQLTGQFLQGDKSLGQKWRNTNLYIHTGNVYGLPGQILAFLASLVCASLPLTGFLVWYGRKNKEKKRRAAIL
ncbi:PepSY-associated TM helix domain-containing protein [Compostibacter hankyongensis]|uniref:PepSY-associated TM helix domain-containing protein n=1 Tax=Compostibacter hankyongensis TaxID=1007089 RepID=A0ABP8FND9_9BACT